MFPFLKCRAAERTTCCCLKPETVPVHLNSLEGKYWFLCCEVELKRLLYCLCLTVRLHVCFVQQGEWSAEKVFLNQQVCLLEQQSREKTSRLEESITSLQTDRQMLQDRVVCSALIFSPPNINLFIVVMRDQSFLFVDQYFPSSCTRLIWTSRGTRQTPLWDRAQRSWSSAG